MTRTTEAGLVLGAAGLAAFGVLLVNLARGRHLDADTAVTLLVLGVALGGLLVAVGLWARHAVPFLIPLAGLLAAVGFVMVFRLDRNLAGGQRWWLLLSAALAGLWLFGVREAGIRSLRRRTLLLWTLALGLVALLFIPPVGWLPLHGLRIGGSLLWVEWDWGFRGQFQPGELVTLILVILLASLLTRHRTSLSEAGVTGGRFHLPRLRSLAPVGIGGIAGSALLFLQGDPSAALLPFGVFLIMLYIATGRPSYLATGSGVFLSGMTLAYFLLPQVRHRIDAWIDPWGHLDGVGYQTIHGLFALAAGSLSGTGPGLGDPDLMPAAATGYVFAAAGEELGLAGAVAIVAAHALLVATGFGIALRATDLFRKLLAAGLSTAFALQTLLVLGGVVRLLPATGLSSPFLSAGGSSTLAGLMIVGLLARISHEERT